MLREIGNLAAVMKTWGHKHVRTTMRYQHPELDIVRDALRQVELWRKTQIHRCHGEAYLLLSVHQRQAGGPETFTA